MTKNEKIAALEEKVAELQRRLAVLEAGQTYPNQWWPQTPTYPSYPYWRVWSDTNTAGTPPGSYTTSALTDL